MTYYGLAPAKYADEPKYGFDRYMRDLPPEKARKTLDLLETIFKNIAQNPKEQKFRKLRISVKKINEAIAEVEGAWEILQDVGFTIDFENEEAYLVLPANVSITFPGHVHKVIDAKSWYGKQNETRRLNAGLGRVNRNNDEWLPWSDEERKTYPKRACVLKDVSSFLNNTLPTSLDDMIASGTLVYIGKEWCPFCEKAKASIENVGIRVDNPEYKMYELENASREPLVENVAQIQDAVLAKVGSRSVPKVFLKGVCLGGGDDIVALEQNGQLKQKFTDAGLFNAQSNLTAPAQAESRRQSAVTSSTTKNGPKSAFDFESRAKKEEKQQNAVNSLDDLREMQQARFKEFQQDPNGYSRQEYNRPASTSNGPQDGAVWYNPMTWFGGNDDDKRGGGGGRSGPNMKTMKDLPKPPQRGG